MSKHTKTTIFIDGKLTDDKCPETESDNCECGGELEHGYGFTHYGLGMHMTCIECCNVYNFCEDMG